MSAPRWLAVGGVLVAAFLLFGSWYTFREADRVRDFNRHAIEADGQLRSIRDCDPGGTHAPPSCLVSATFRTSEGRTIEFDQPVNPNELRHVDPSTVSILYDARDPTHARLDRPSETWERVFAVGELTFALTLLALVAVDQFDLRRLKIGRHKTARW